MGLVYSCIVHTVCDDLHLPLCKVLEASTRPLEPAVSNFAPYDRWSGLIRGAVSVALVYYHFDPAGKSEDSHRATLITTTLIEVMVSIFVFGAATKPLLDYLLGPEGTSHISQLATDASTHPKPSSLLLT